MLDDSNLKPGNSLCSIHANTSKKEKPTLVPDGAEQLSNILHICILSRPKANNTALAQQTTQSLSKYGISNEIEDVTSNHKHLSEPEYRYNLRYNTRGNDNSINYLSLLIRTPNHRLPASAHILILTLKTNKRKSLIRQQCSIGLRYGH